MKILQLFLIIILGVTSCKEGQSRSIEDFNYNWKFNLGDESKASEPDFNDNNWKSITVPHDWSIEAGYLKEGETASSTGFVPGGIGWYRKAFTLNPEDKDKHISVLFDGVYNNSSVWINGHFLGKRPYGYSSFSYDLTNHLKIEGDNVIAVKVDRKAYVDSRWYTGSGIYRKVQLIKKSKLHLKQWGIKITTPDVTEKSAKVAITTEINVLDILEYAKLSLRYLVEDFNGNAVTSMEDQISNVETVFNHQLTVNNPKLWSTLSPNLYTLKVELLHEGKVIDNTTEIFGIRTFNFDAKKGFFLNKKPLKIKGVNLHHDAGAVGTAVPKALWEYRVEQLKSIGVNAIRFAHNPHSVELLEVCDEKGILVMNEAFDEWHVPKAKSKVYLGDNATSKAASKSYPEVFKEWSERDLKDLVKRDFNHPSVFMWSIGNEIEWTFPHYSKTFNDVNGESGAQGYDHVPVYDEALIKKAFDKNITDDPLVKTAKQLVSWVKDIDTSRPITCGSVLPSIGMASGYGKVVDVFGYNYRASDYDVAHAAYPDLKIIGAENWGDYLEWKRINDRDFVAGIFVWTGFAYLGEAGPWPRKGLNISFFDFAGFKTPRGHFFECLWKKEPKIYMVTTPANESEFLFKNGEWNFEMQLTPPPVWNMLRKWEWYKVYPKWKYGENDPIVVQTYTNCEEAELFLNGTSLGRQSHSKYAETDNIIKWLVPYKAGELKVIGYNNGQKADEYILNTNKTSISKIKMESNKTEMKADGYDVAVIKVNLLDDNDNLVVDADQEVEFKISGPAKNIGVDNGWEMNVQHHKTNTVKTHQGKAVIFVQSKKEKGAVKVSASVLNTPSENLKIMSN